MLVKNYPCCETNVGHPCAFVMYSPTPITRPPTPTRAPHPPTHPPTPHPPHHPTHPTHSHPPQSHPHPPHPHLPTRPTPTHPTPPPPVPWTAWVLQSVGLEVQQHLRQVPVPTARRHVQRLPLRAQAHAYGNPTRRGSHSKPGIKMVDPPEPCKELRRRISAAVPYSPSSTRDF